MKFESKLINFRILVDADAAPVKQDVFRVALHYRHAASEKQVCFSGIQEPLEESVIGVVQGSFPTSQGKNPSATHQYEIVQRD